MSLASPLGFSGVSSQTSRGLEGVEAGYGASRSMKFYRSRGTKRCEQRRGSKQLSVLPQTHHIALCASIDCKAFVASKVTSPQGNGRGLIEDGHGISGIETGHRKR